MEDRLETEQHPVAYGLLALLGVALVIGLIVGLAALAGTRVLGLGEATAPSGTQAEATMYLPKPEKTQAATGPEITLAPGESSPPAAEPSQEKATEKKRAKVISLSLGRSEVAPMEQIDLTGVYPGGEGAILQVQRFENGTWVDFYSVTATVSDQTFSTYVQTGQAGVHRFRVMDTSSGKTSNEVRVTVD